MSQSVLGEVFTPAELARAAGVALHDVSALIDAGELTPIAGTSYIAGRDALQAGRRLCAASAAVTAGRPELFDGSPGRTPLNRRTGLPAVASSALHAAIVALVVWFSAAAADMEAIEEPPSTGRLVFIMTPGPGGGGGGGGLRSPLPAPKIRRRGTERQRTAVPAVIERPVVAEKRDVETPKPPTPPPAPTPVERPPDPAPTPVLVAPVVATAPDPASRDGVIERGRDTASSRGPGAASGAGTGQGTGNGEGSGSGIGDGAGGGTGGGPYRPGSGIDPPRLLREVKAVYTEDGRRRSITGNVLLEIVVRRDGSVGDVSVLRGLGAGLDQRAVEAVRQWRFSPARRLGTPVDVIVEVAVEFTLR